MCRKLILVLGVVTLLAGCGEEEVQQEPVHSVTLQIGNEQIIYNVEDDETVLSYSDNQIIIDKRGDIVQVDYVQGNSLNDFIQAYYDGLSGDKTELVDGTFKVDDITYYMSQTKDLNYLIVKGDKKHVEDLSERLS